MAICYFVCPIFLSLSFFDFLYFVWMYSITSKNKKEYVLHIVNLHSYITNAGLYRISVTLTNSLLFCVCVWVIFVGFALRGITAFEKRVLHIFVVPKTQQIFYFYSFHFTGFQSCFISSSSKCVLVDFNQNKNNYISCPGEWMCSIEQKLPQKKETLGFSCIWFEIMHQAKKEQKIK